jgi:hypothetical protein
MMTQPCVEHKGVHCKAPLENSAGKSLNFSPKSFDSPTRRFRMEG